VTADDAGTATVTATRYGFRTATATTAVPGVGDLALQAAPLVTLSGTIRDGAGLGTPIGATVEVVGSGLAPVPNDPVTGFYSVRVPAGGDRVLRVRATGTGYRTVSPVSAVAEVDAVRDVLVPIDAESCTAAGYRPVYRQVRLSQSFDAATVPPGWTVSSGWRFDDPRGRGNRTGGTGGFAVADNQAGIVSQAKLNAPAISVAGLANPYVRFRSDVTHAGNAQYHLMATTAPADVDSDWRFVHSVRDRGVWHDWVEAPLTGLGDPSNVRLRFLTNGSLSSVWQVDDVVVGDRGCAPA
jgi:hypothetical protein